jgi:parallel beta-helix repeat protein
MQVLSKYLNAFVLLTSLTGAHQAYGADLDVRSFGAACNGINDDRGALQQALNAVQSGGTVLIPCVLGVGSGGVVLQGKSNVTVRGTVSGAGLKALGRPVQGVQGFGPVLFVVRQCTSCRVQGLTFEGNNVHTALLGFDRCVSAVAEGNTLRNIGGNVAGGVLSAAGNSGNQYLRNTIQNVGVYNGNEPRGMWLGNPGTPENEWYPTVVGNTVLNGAGTGIAMHTVGATVTDNVVDKTNGAGIKMVPIAGQTAAAVIERNTVRNNKFHGIQIESASNLTVRNNVTERNLMGGIFVYLGFSNSSITGNTVRDNNYDKQGGWQGGIYVHHAQNVTISNNQIYDTRSGSSRSQDNAIILNAVSPNGIRNVKVTGNTCRNHLENGISIQNNGSGTMSEIEVSGNTCGQNTRYGLHVDEKTAWALRNISEGGNNFDSNGAGRLYDDSLQGVISGAIAPPVQGLTASISSPSNYATVSGTITLSASVSSGATITGVQFKVDGANYGAEVRQAPFALQLDTTDLTNGTHSVSATARDANNQVVNTATISFTVSNTSSSSSPTTTTPKPFVTSYSPGSQVNGGVSNAWVGMRLRVGGAPITVTHLGRWKHSNNTQTHTLKIVNASTGQDLSAAAVQISMSGKTNGQFAYAALPAAVTLNANTEYLIVSSEHTPLNNGDFFYDYNGSMATTSAGQALSAVYWGGSSWVRLGSTNANIGPVSFQYR